MNTLPGHIVTINTGSATVKFDIYETRSGIGKKIGSGTVEHIGQHPRVIFSSQSVNIHTVVPGITTIEQAVEKAFDYIALLNPGVSPAEWLEAVGVRFVHGGSKYRKPLELTEEVLTTLERMTGLAPLHNRHAIQAVRALRQRLPPTVRMVAVFDTHFHHTLPPHAYTYALPAEVSRTYGIKRYGFHGLAHEYMLERYAELTKTPRNLCTIITLQLGSGSSACAIQDGQSVDTSMGFTPLEGLMMRTRSGDIDPGVLFHIARASGMSIPKLEQLLNTESGLAGISGTDGDTKTLIAAYHHDQAARLAIDMYTYRIIKYIGSYLAILTKPQAIIFGGGIGEHAAFIRERILDRLDHVGVGIDYHSNNAAIGRVGRITKPASTIEAYVIPVDESKLIYRYTRQVV